MGSTSTTTALDAKSNAVKEKRKKVTERMARGKGRGGEGLIKKKRMVDDEEEDGNVIPSRSQKSKERMENDVDSTHAGLKKRGDGDVHATTSARTTKRADNSGHPLKSKINLMFLVYHLPTPPRTTPTPTPTLPTTPLRLPTLL
jgi:hypothetical protein